MAMFDDLIPAQQQAPAAEGLFDDLIPAAPSPAAPPAAAAPVDTKKYPYSADNWPYDDNSFVSKRKTVNGVEYRLHKTTGAIYAPDGTATDDPEVMAAFGKTKLSKRGQARADVRKPMVDSSATSILDNAISSIPGIGQQYSAAKWAIQTGQEIADTPQETTDAMAAAAQRPDQSSIATDWQAGSANVKTAYLGQQIIGLRDEITNLTRTAKERPDDQLIRQRLARAEDAYQRAYQMYDEASGQQFPQNPTFAALHDKDVPGTPAQKTAAAFRADPWGVGRTLTLQSGPVSIPSVAGGIIGSIAAGRPGAAFGAGVPSAYIEAGLNLRDQIAARGADMNDPASRRATFEKYADEIIRDAQISGLIVGAGDAAGAMFGSGVAALEGKGASNLVGKELVGTIADALFGAAGEGGKQVYNTGGISDPQSLIDEGLGEVVAGGVQQGGMLAVEGLKSAGGKTDRQVQPPGQRIEPRLFDDLVPSLQAQTPAGNKGGKPATSAAPPVTQDVNVNNWVTQQRDVINWVSDPMAQADVLRQTGYSLEQIAAMNPQERTDAAAEAAQQGYRPMGTIAPDAPPVGSAPNAPRPAPASSIQQQNQTVAPQVFEAPIRTENTNGFSVQSPAPGTAPMATRAPRAELAQPAQDPAPVSNSQPISAQYPANTITSAKPAQKTEFEQVDTPSQLSVADAALSKYLGTRQPLTAEAFAASSGLSPRDAGKALQRAALAGNLIQTRTGRWMRPPRRVKPVSALAYIASIGGIRDDTGELRSMDLKGKMTEYGPVLRPKGLHPDKIREALVEAGYLRDPAAGTGRPTESTIEDLYALIDNEMRGAKQYTPQDQTAADAIATQAKNDQMDPEWQPVHPISQAFGMETWEKVQAFFADNGSYEEAWSQSEVSDAARLISQGWNADDAFERAAFMHIDEVNDPEQDIDPELTRKFAANRQIADTAFDHPPFPDVEPQPDAIQQPGSQEAGAGIRETGGQDGNAVSQAEDAGPAAQVPDVGQGGGEAGAGGQAAAVDTPEQEAHAVWRGFTPAGRADTLRQLYGKDFTKDTNGPHFLRWERLPRKMQADLTAWFDKGKTAKYTPTTETGADNKPQLVIPGAEQDVKGAMQNAAKKPLKGAKPQKGMDVGLFGDAPNSPELFDTPAKAPAKWKPIGANSAGNPIFEDDRGVRSYTENGIRFTEPVQISPNGVLIIANRSWEYQPTEDAQPETPTKPATSTKPSEKPAVQQVDTYGANNTLVTPDRAAELRKRLKDKLKNQASSGIDPEMMAMGAELAAYHIEAGARRFADFAKAIASDLDTTIKTIRPYLRSWYNGARDMMEDAGLDVTGMDTPDQVKASLAALDKEADNDAGNRTGDVGQDGVAEDQPELANGQPQGEGVDPTLAQEPPTDGGSAAAAKRPRTTRTRPASQDDGKPSPEPGSGNAGTGRTGASSEGLAADGAGTGRPADQPEPVSLRPNYHIADPESLIGGTPKVRFAKNRKAIETYRSLSDEARDPMPEDLDAIAGYIGWGSFGQELFQGSWQYPRPKDGWEKEDKWLRDHLGQDEWESAQRSIINAHYTDPPTVTAMWDMVRRMGFTGGRVLEPSMGIGNFFGLMPREIMEKSDLTGIELDALTGGMAQILYPRANIQIKGYETSKTPDGFYDLVIGNWPFAADGPSDRRYDKLSPTLHDYFFIKALDQVRPGGLVVGITSSGSMDKVGRSARAAMEDRADLVAAYRLPSGAFEKYAGTSVVTDIIILQKREPKAERKSDAPWMDTKEINVPGGQIKTNAYWLERPANVLGRMGFGHGTTRGRPGMIVERLPDFMDALSALPSRVPQDIYQPIKRGKEPRFITNNTKDRDGSIIDQDGKFYVVQGERLALLDDLTPAFRIKDTAKAANRKDQVARLIGLRRAYGALIDAERSSLPETETLRATLRKEYEAFKKKHGTIKDSEGLSIFDKIEDPFAPALAALETPQGKPARILSESTTRQRKTLDKPSVNEAFVLARNESMMLNLDRVAELSGIPRANVERDLLSSKAIYRTPGGGFEISDIFLSGNVRRKLRELQDAKDRGEDVDASIEAIKSVLPKDVPYFQIEAKMGATWVPNEYYSQFVADLLGVGSQGAEQIDIKFRAGTWSVKFKNNAYNDKPEATTTWGHSAYPFSKLIRAALNNMTITIRYKDQDGNMVTDAAATQEVNNKAARVREEFTAWAWRETDRKVFLERQYNDIMNAMATPKYDGSFLDFSGMALHRGTDSFSLRSHQSNAIWRGVANRRGLYAHEVGTGKTYTMGGIAVESRRYGIARKPLLIAHNANSATVAKEIQEMYPGAAVLYVSTLGKEDMQITMRRMANEDWDVIVIPHSLIDRMALSEKTLMDIAAEDIRALEEEAIAAAKEDNVDLDILDMDSEDKMKKVRSTTAKQLVHQRNKIIKSIKDMANRASKEGAVFFEDLGIDMIMVDEVHEFKKPPLATRQKLKGLNTQTSNRSVALRFLTDYVKRLNGGTGVHIFTGTPITNTLTEIYNMMRYVMDKDMEVDGIKDWDAWFNTFADSSTDVELSATADYEPVTRLAAFVNVAELRRMAGNVMDIVFADDMPEFKPRLTETGKTLAAKDLTEIERQQLLNGRTERPMGRPYKKMIIDTGPMGRQQQAILERLISLATEFKNATGKQRRDWLMKGDERVPIRVETSAANAGLDPRLEDMGAADEPTSKANRAVKNILLHYREHEQSTQVIFMERGFSDSSTRTVTDGDGKKTSVKVARFNLVDDIIEKLTAQGIPRKEIAVVDGSTSKEKRKEIADKMNRAEVRVVIGNTRTLGVGVNMQTNLRAMHHLDAPWTPGELEQRNGRGWRQGNKWNTVLEYRYITEKLDGRRWQVLAVKDRFIKAFMKADDSIRVIDGDAVSMDESESADDLARTLSEAAGDPRILQMNKMASDVQKLENRERLHTFGIADAKQKVNEIRAQITSNRTSAARVSADADAFESAQTDEFQATIDGKSYDKRADASDALEKLVITMPAGSKSQKIGQYRGFAIMAQRAFEYAGPSVWVEGKGSYNVKPSFNSIDPTLRNLRKQAQALIDTTEQEASISRLEAMIGMPFAQQKQLDAKKSMLTDIRRDLEINPVPPPSWLRHGAPVDTLIYVDGKPRPVAGHKWNSDGFFVVTDEGLVPYRDAKTDNGDFVYEEHEFTTPVDKSAAYSKLSDEAVKQGWTVKEINGEWHVIAPGQYSAAKGPTKTQAIMAFNMDPNFSYLKNKTERLSSLSRSRSVPDRTRVAVMRVEIRELASRILGHQISDVQIVEDMEAAGFSRDENAVYDPNTNVITIALDAAQDPRTSLRHEAIHALRQAGVFTAQEWAALARLARTRWIDQHDIRNRYERLYRERFDIPAEQIEELLVEEAIAEAFADYRANPRGEDLVSRIFDRVMRFLEAVANMARGHGYRTSADVFEAIDRGDVAGRQRGQGQSRDFLLYGRQASAREDVTKTEAFAKWFGASKVVDAQGRPLVVYHGTPAGDFESFDTYASNYGLMGQGGYFTEDASVASEYTNKGAAKIERQGGSPAQTVYPVYVSIKNPLDMNAALNKEEWANAFSDYLSKDDFSDAETNEDAYRIVEDVLTDEMLPKWEGAEIIQDGIRRMGHDGITHIGGQYVRKDGKEHRVWIAFDPEQIKSVHNAGTFDPTNPAILSSRRRTLQPPRNAAAGSFEAPHDERVLEALTDSTATILDRIRRAGASIGNEYRRKAQDREVDLLRTQGAITKAGGRIAEPQDAYLAASLYPGRVAQRDRDLVTDVIEPLITDIARRKLTLDEVDTFNRARHAFERNIAIGQLYKPGEQFHEAMYNSAIVGGSGLSDDQAGDILTDFQRNGKYADLEAVGDKIVALNRQTIDKLLAEGLLTQEQHDAMTAKYQYYVPLRGHDEATDETHPDAPRTGSRYDVRGQEVSRAFGRTSQSDSPLAYSIMQARQAIGRIEKNRVGKRFLRLAQANPNEAFWQVNRRDRKKIIDRNTGLVRYVNDPGVTDAENVLAVKVGGQAYHITMHHTGLAAAMKGMGTENMHSLVVNFHKINRYLASMYTSYSPEFIFTNLLRDLQQTGIVLQEEKVKGITRSVLAAMPKAAAGMNAMLRGDLSSPWARYAREYADAGGKMGFMGRNDIETEKRSLERLMREQDPSKSLKAWMVLRDEVVGRLDRYNDSIENTLRLATYVALRNAGVSRDKAAFSARELTVNFNRKGEWSSGINAFYLFFNAASQGAASLAMRFARSKTIRRVCYGIMLSAFAQDMLNRMIAGDDDDGENRYDKIPDEIKARNGIVMFPKWLEDKTGVPYLKWPLPLGYNMFHVIGTQVGHAAAGARTPLEAAAEAVSSVANAFNPLGGGGTILNFFSPTLLDPAADIATNTNFFGENIIPRVFDETTPYAERYKDNVNPAAKWITETLSQATGGSPERKGGIDWSPEWVEHVWDFAAGGVGRMINNASTTTRDLFMGADVDATKVPFARTFVGQTSKFADRDAYYEIKDAVHVTQKEIEARQKEGDTAAVQRIQSRYARELRMIKAVDEAEKNLAKLRRDMRAVKALQTMGAAAKRTRIDEISRRMDAIQLDVRRAWNAPEPTAKTSAP